MVCVEWEDASFNSGYYDSRLLDEFEPVLTKSVGFIVKSNRGHVSISHDRFYNKDNKPDGDRHITVIPRAMIKHIGYLHE